MLLFRQLVSPDLDLNDMIALVREIEWAVANGASGVVVTQVTDTLAETAFSQLPVHGEAPGGADRSDPQTDVSRSGERRRAPGWPHDDIHLLPISAQTVKLTMPSRRSVVTCP